MEKPFGRYFEDFQSGEVFRSGVRVITEGDLKEFAKVSGDHNPLHTDAEFGKNNRFGRQIAHGVLSLAILTGFWDDLGLWRNTIVAFYGINKLRFTKPVFIGDTVHAKITLMSKEKKGGGNGLLTLSNELLNQREEVVMVCDTLVLVRSREEG